jgi:serine/threonine-protein kinase
MGPESDRARGPSGALGATDLIRAEEVCERFEAGWRAGGTPSLEDGLAGLDGPIRAFLLRELLLLELAYRTRRGERPILADYLARFPDDEDPVRSAFESAASQGGLPGSQLPTHTWGPGAAPGPEGHGPPSSRDERETHGRYAVMRLHAKGGIGQVWVARDADLGRDVALKELQPHRAGQADARARFLLEAQITGQLEHPGIVPIYELDRRPRGRPPYYAMRFVRGRTLSQAVRTHHTRDASGAPDRAALLGAFAGVCNAVAYAHSRGVIHRDLKGSNVLLGDFGEVIVLDWGLAKLIGRPEAGAEPGALPPVAIEGGAAHEPTLAGEAMGTPAYMAPEQARGEVDRLDERCDVFALGSILCELLTGRPAFTGGWSGEILHKARLGDLADAFSRLDRSGAEPELIALARDCLAPEPTDRPRDAGVVAGRLSVYLAGVQERLRQAELARVEAQARAEEERKRRKLQVGLAASLLGLVVLGGGGGLYLQRQRAIRREATALSVQKRLDEVAGLRGKAETTPDAVAGWDLALAELKGAEDVLRHGELDSALAARLAAVRTDLERGRSEADARAKRRAAERRLVDRLETVRADRAEHSHPAETDREYLAAFRGFGVDFDATGLEDAGRALAGLPSSVEIATALDDWSLVRWLDLRMRSDDRPWKPLNIAARVADPDPFRNDLRALVGRPLEETVVELKRRAADAESLNQEPAASLVLLAMMLQRAGAPDESAAVLRRAWQRDPSDFWVNFELGHSSDSDGTGGFSRPDEAIRHFTAALAIRRESYGTRLHLGLAVNAKGDLDAAIAQFREAIRLKPGDSAAHNSLANSLSRRGDLDAAIAQFRETMRLKPGDGRVHSNLGNALSARGDLDAAIAQFREAMRLKPGDALVHYNLGNALSDKGDIDAAIGQLREAIRLKPGYANAHYNLGNALSRRGDLDAAIAQYREAVRLKPGDADAHCNLGHALRRRGRYSEALLELRLGHELGSKQPGWSYDSAGWVRRCERLAALDARLPDLLKGMDKPRDAAEAMDLGRLCYDKALHAAAARFWADVFAADPRLAADRQAQHRFDAACCAALAGCGRAKDDPPLDEAAQAGLRRQALDWLKAELAAWSKVADAGAPEGRAAAAAALAHWRRDSDLAGIRDDDALARLPEAERTAWRALWAEADALLAPVGDAGAKGKAPTQPPKP